MKNNHITTLLVAAIICLGMLYSSCAQAPPTTQAPKTSQVTSQDIVLTIASPVSKSDLKTEACYRLAEAVKNKTNGKVKFDVYDSGSLIVDKDMVASLPAGIADFGQADTSTFSGIVPLGALPTTCGFWVNQEHLWRFMDGEYRQMLSQELEQKANIKFIAFLSNGPTDCLASRSKTIKNLDDVKGKKFRTPPGPPYLAALDSLGASPVMISAAETYTALQRGTVDAILSNGKSLTTYKWLEVSPYVTKIITFPDTGHCLLANLDSWKKLPTNVQQIIMECAQEQQSWSREVSYSKAGEYWDQYQKTIGTKEGLNEIYNMPENEVAKWQKVIIPGQIEYVNSLKIPSEQLKKILDLIEKSKYP